MDSRIRKIFDLLSEDKYKTAENLSEKLNISSKTARKLLKELNEILEKSGAVVISKSGYGYILKIYDREKFLDINLSENGNTLPVTSEERNTIYNRIYDKYKELHKGRGLIKNAFISGKTLAKDIKEAEKVLEEYNIKLERKPYYGMKLKGNEFSFRLCIAGYIQRKNENEGKIDFTDESEMAEIARIIIGTLKKEKISDIRCCIS